MDTENENKTEGMSTEQSEGGREGYQHTGSSDNYARDYRSGGRTQRPRIHTQKAYSTERRNEEEGGFRPEGFGAGLQNSGGRQRPYRPRYNNNYDYQQGGYQPRQQGGYQPRQQGGYQPRQQGGYQPRQQGDYQPRQQGDYQSRQQGDYQPRQQGGYQPRQQGG